MEFWSPSIAENLGVLSGWIQIVLAARQRSPVRKSGPKDQKNKPAVFTISRRAAIGIIFSFALISAAAMWPYVFRPEYRYYKKDQLELISEQHFLNEELEIDGKLFQRCTFDNVTLKINGRANFGFEFNNFRGPVKLKFGTEQGKLSAEALLHFLQQANMIANGQAALVDKDGDIGILPTGQQPSK